MSTNYHVAISGTFYQAPDSLIDELRASVPSNTWKERAYADYVEVSITGTICYMYPMQDVLAKLMPFCNPEFLGVYTYEGQGSVHLLLQPPFDSREPRIVDVDLKLDEHELASQQPVIRMASMADAMPVMLEVQGLPLMDKHG